MKRKIRLTEDDIRMIVNESVKSILNENAYTEAGVWDLLERLEGFMSDKDIIARIISRIGPDEAVRILKDIMAVEGNGDWDAYLQQDDDVLQ
jgi:hypothetical protein